MPTGSWTAFSFAGIGTDWEISTPLPLPAPLQSQLLATVEKYDAAWSRFRADSLVTKLAGSAGRVEFPPEAARLGALYQQLYRITGGAMTPLIGGSLERLGYDAGYSLVPSGPALPAPAWEGLLEWAGTSIGSSRPLVLDIGAAGKGLLVDLLAEVLRAQGLTEFLIDASGDMLHSGTEPLRIGLEHPYQPTQAIGVVELFNSALCASAANRRAWGDGLHHVLDGATGKPVSTVVATWSTAATAMEADALATALFLTDPATLEQDFDFDWLTVYSAGNAAFSAHFEGTLFS
ncbi:Thiamine biosynthesis lipoprotein ApbE precursor [Arthrobacter ulcerisalmonis]|uniref:FAD:protein FMN transferase n=1 Tax=Arthrobacter ulcerisalmonis TaxID=2483813 RepID=A0A3P5XEJ1_9MICC|nr:FAD:protein FMN transferase [Arthrobacter ulcerisalmonis]VDC25964.1 Thiamine biosynthesis lipoprotein ApbE precursor [Arthrobacter ulcerisalmonis]